MTIDQFEPEDPLLEISRKLSNVNIYKVPAQGGSIDKDALPTIQYLIFSQEPEKIKESIRMLRRYLTQDSSGKNDEHTVNDILALDILPRIKELLETHSNNSIKFECAWIITNIAAGTSEQTNTIIAAGFVDTLLECLRSKNSSLELKAQAAWALGNIAGESPRYREELLKKGYTKAMIMVLDHIYHHSLKGRKVCLYENYANVEALLWALTNMSRGGFHVANYSQFYLPMFRIFSQYLEVDEMKLKIEVCWGLARILYNMHEVDHFYNSNMISVKLCEQLLDLLRTGIPKYVVPALRTIANITSGPNRSLRNLLNTPVLPVITPLLHPSIPADIRKDGFLAISNLAAGDEYMIKKIVQYSELIKNVLTHITVPGHIFDEERTVWEPTICHAYYNQNVEWKLTRDALWIIFNIISLGNDSSILDLLCNHPNIPDILLKLFNYACLPPDTCEKLIQATTSLVQRTNKHSTNGKNPSVTLFINHGILSYLELIQKNYNECGIKDSCLKLVTLLNASEQNVAQTASISDVADVASAFGLPTVGEIKSKSSKRRVLRGLEDGDVRFIENAVGNLYL
ncbi:armadillo-type protein [Cokeromyces recurvatus]|uniref:armadillo-type protein n=1 Tax=Cokeromyces recurvatus TaxID=90255 RepID=UPI00222113C1|nr:armadillo-type protein [Cokeromyces recurvatus]KAI7904970.1 armadillo-type protein [Cokeromyces recurvatus]